MEAYPFLRALHLSPICQREGEVEVRGGADAGDAVILWTTPFSVKAKGIFSQQEVDSSSPVMMHNWNTSIHSGGFQYGRPLRTNYYSFANVRESPPFNIIFWSFFPRFDYASLQTLVPQRPLPPSHPFPSVWLPVSCSLSASAAVNSKQAGSWFSALFGWHKQAQWVIHTILKNSWCNKEF